MMAEREYTWAELHPSVFDKETDFRPLIPCFGNQGGDERIEVSWEWGQRAGPVGQIHVSTADPDEDDVDEIEAHWTFIKFSTREGWIEAYRTARRVAKGGKFADVEPGVFYDQPGGWSVNPAPQHIREAA